VDNLDCKLEDLEKEREKNLSFFCDKLEFTLIDIAFDLEPQVKAFVDVRKIDFIAIFLGFDHTIIVCYYFLGKKKGIR